MAVARWDSEAGGWSGDDSAWRPSESHREYLERMGRRNARIGLLARRPSPVRSIHFTTFDELWWRLSNDG